jgi:hypothetical protein
MEVPIGTIIAFGGKVTAIPNNYLLCDGKKYDRDGDYRDLFAAIDLAWGGDAVEFNVPDLRGLFLRGVNGTREGDFCDPDSTNRSSGNAVGSIQPDAIRSHSHGYTAPPTGGSYGGGNPGNIPQNPPPANPTTAPFGGSETRPKNAYVYYLIKARN